ncbi:protein PFC0760c [Senna tora]|uniref:Protein PFC0760c n=1 Tax=Senna tora TaxID=362788 RepID=A0A834XB23_9FABA|nr:protein PFC0760c [Senna tora]
MENQSSSPMDFLLLEDVQFFEVQDDGDDALLSQWQFVDVVDTEVEEEGRGENCGNDDKKFERQRMRKLGKRGFAKMQSAKRSPYLSMKPGCVHGKHGMGLKHNF